MLVDEEAKGTLALLAWPDTTLLSDGLVANGVRLFVVVVVIVVVGAVVAAVAAVVVAVVVFELEPNDLTN